MTKTESGKKYALIAAMCYAVYAIYHIIDGIIYVSNSEYATITVFDILFWIGTLGMAVALFMKNQKIVIAFAGVNALFEAYNIVINLSTWHPSLWHIYFYLLCSFLAYASVVVFVVLTLKGNDVAKKIWFVPAAVLLLGYVILWINGGYFMYLSALWESMLVSIVEIVALLFAGMWVKEIVAPAEASPVNEYATSSPQRINSTQVSSSAIGSADKLKMYKDLLESGTITQEEFDAKKKQILGLTIDQNIIIKGTPQKNKVSAIMLTTSVIAFVCALLFSVYAYNNLKGYFYSGWNYGHTWYYCVGYDDFWAYFWGEFFSFRLMYGYILIASVITFVVSIIMKTNTEKCEITVTNEAISGKLPHGKEVHIPLNQITAISRSSFNGISITSIGNVSNFYCIENREEVMMALSYLLANPQQNAQPTQNGSAPVANGSEAEQLKRLKDLLDAGVLTQEEFDAKKKQVLGL